MGFLSHLLLLLFKSGAVGRFKCFSLLVSDVGRFNGRSNCRQTARRPLRSARRECCPHCTKRKKIHGRCRNSFCQRLCFSLLCGWVGVCFTAIKNAVAWAPGQRFFPTLLFRYNIIEPHPLVCSCHAECFSLQMETFLGMAAQYAVGCISRVMSTQTSCSGESSILSLSLSSSFFIILKETAILS